MASTAALGSKTLRAGRSSIRACVSTKRGLAAAASGSFQYQSGEAGGVKYASRDLPGATTTLTVVAKAGTRYQPFPGYSDALEKFAFKVGYSSCAKYFNLYLQLRSLRSNDLPFELLEKSNF